MGAFNKYCETPNGPSHANLQVINPLSKTLTMSSLFSLHHKLQTLFVRHRSPSLSNPHTPPTLDTSSRLPTQSFFFSKACGKTIGARSVLILSNSRKQQNCRKIRHGAPAHKEDIPLSSISFFAVWR